MLTNREEPLRTLFVALSLTLILTANTAFAQTMPPNETGVTMGHLPSHLYTKTAPRPAEFLAPSAKRLLQQNRRQSGHQSALAEQSPPPNQALWDDTGIANGVASLNRLSTLVVSRKMLLSKPLQGSAPA